MIGVGRKTKYSNHHQSDDVYLLNVCSAPELGHTPAILWGRPFVFGMNSPEHHPGVVGRFVGARHDTHQGIPIPCSECHNAMISMEVVGLEGLEPSIKGFTIPCTRCHCVGKPKNPNAFPMTPFRGDRNRPYAEPGYGRL